MSVDFDTKILGIDLGGTKILTVVTTPQGKILSTIHSTTPAKEGRDAVIKSILESATRVIEQANMVTNDISVIGVAAPGLSNPETGILFTSPNLPGWKDVPLSDIVEDKFGRKAFLINDANAAALGELYFGAGRGALNLIYVTVSTGIGGGIIINGKIYTGSIGTAGEIGHMVIDVEGPSCRCGNRGCWEALASGTALAREATERINAGESTSILKRVDGEIERINAEVIHEAARDGDRLANELVARIAYYLGVGLSNLINIFNPEIIIVGGGLSNMGNMLLKPAIKEAGRRAFRRAYREVRFAVAELGRNSGVMGAAAYALEQLSCKTGIR